MSRPIHPVSGDMYYDIETYTMYLYIDNEWAKIITMETLKKIHDAKKKFEEDLPSRWEKIEQDE